MCILKLKVKRFVHLLVLLVINRGCPKNCKKLGNTTLLISSSNYAKRHINVCLGGDLCSPFFSNFSEIPCVKIGFNVNDFLRMMNESRLGDSIFFCLPRLYSTCGDSLFVIQKAKLLHMNTVVNISPGGCTSMEK